MGKGGAEDEGGTKWELGLVLISDISSIIVR